MSLNFGQIRTLTTELSAHEGLNKSTYNVVVTIGPSVLIESSSFLQVTRTCIKAWMSPNFGKTPPLTTGLATLGRLINKSIYNVFATSAPSFLIGSIMLTGNEYKHKSLVEFEIQPDPPTDYM